MVFGRIEDYSPDYIEEKFNKYFNTPILNKDYNYGRLDKYEIFKNWKSRWGDYNVYLLLILEINMKSFYIFRGENESNLWKTSELISLYENFIDVEKINKEEYINLHDNIKGSRKEWLEIPSVENDYKRILRDIKIKELLNN